MEGKIFLAFDIGASSGRALLISFQGEKFEMREIHRFTNRILEMHGRYYWDVFHIYDELKQALTLCGKEKIELASIGIDTWGVDFGLVGADGTILGLPRAYRDPYTMKVPEIFFKEQMTRGDVYHRTGIQIMDFNSLYQLYQQRKENYSPLKQAAKALFIPDLLAYMLTGNRVCEYTDASTSQLVNPYTKEMDRDLLEAVGVPLTLFDKIVFPGTVVGTLTKSLAQETGVGPVKVIAVAGHDTASAVAGVPTVDPEFAYLSSGTWSLMGIETEEPIISDESYRENFTNEGGIDGTIRFLKNITGMWLLERCKDEWKQSGSDYSYVELINLMEQEEAFRSFVNPNDACFANPDNMQRAIRNYCQKTKQPQPESIGQYVRCIFESLAFSYRKVLNTLKEMAPFPIRRLHIIGGGAKNDFLNQLIADVIQMPVVAGPSEATAIGNGLVQARAAGLVNNRWEMRRLILASVSPKIFIPQHSAENYESAYQRFISLTSK